MTRLRDLGEFEKSELVAARTSAAIMGFIKTQDSDDFINSTTSEGDNISELEAGTIKMLQPGESFEGFSPSRNSNSYDAFSRSQLRAIATGIGISYEALSGDFSQSNYSSSRLALLSDRDNYKTLQEWFLADFCQPVFEEWLDLEVLSGRLKLKNYELKTSQYYAVKWQPRGWAWVDPQKEINSTIASIDAGLTTLTDEVAKQGGDIESVLKARRRELDLAESLGLKLYSPPTAQAVINVEDVINNA